MFKFGEFLFDIGCVLMALMAPFLTTATDHFSVPFQLVWCGITALLFISGSTIMFFCA